MPSLVECMYAIRAVYKENGGEPFPGWEKSRTYYENGFGAACYINREQREVVIAFRGTQLTEFANLRDDLQLAFGFLPESFIQACHFDDQLRDSVSGIIPLDFNITYVGHSLGAVHASLLACLRKGVAITLESPGVFPLIERNLRLIEGSREAKIINFLSAPNAINTLHPQVGQSFRVYTDHIDDISYNHLFKCILGSTKRTAATIAAVASTAVTGGSSALVATGAIASSVAFTTDRISNHIIIKAVDYLTWLKKQHSAKNLYAALHIEEQYFPKIARIDSWPSLTMAYPFILTVTTSTLNTWIPFHVDIEGLHNLYEENRLLEQRLQGIPGYVVSVLEEAREAIAFQKTIFTVLHPQRMIVDRSPLSIAPTDDVIRSLVTYAIASQNHVAEVLESSESEQDALIIRQSTENTSAVSTFMCPTEIEIDNACTVLQQRTTISQSIVLANESSANPIFSSRNPHTTFSASTREASSYLDSTLGLTREQFIAQQQRVAEENAKHLFDHTFSRK